MVTRGARARPHNMSPAVRLLPNPTNSLLVSFAFPPARPPSLPPSLPASLPPTLQPSLPHSLPPSLRPSVPPSLRPSLPPCLPASLPPSPLPPSLRPSLPPALVSKSRRLERTLFRVNPLRFGRPAVGSGFRV
jgi:hypothetical protein